MGFGRVIALASLVALGASCADGHSGSSTPQITAGQPDPALDDLLLTAGDLRDVAGLPSVEEHQLDDAGLFENPDPRGPCGGPVPDLPLGGSAGRAYTADAMSMFELVASDSSTHEAYFAALLADVSPDCGDYESQTNTGGTQHVTENEILDLEQLEVPIVAYTAVIDVEGRRLYAMAIAMRTADHFIFVQGIAANPFHPDTVEAVARRAVDRAAA